MAYRKKEIQSVIYGGGLDLVSPQIQVAPGRLIYSKNVEADLINGYSVMEGFERVDGQTSATEGDWFAIETADTTDFATGELVTGGTSGATGTQLEPGTEALYLVGVIGTFVDGEALTSPSASSTATSDPLANILFDDDLVYNDVRLAKEIYYRDFIQVVPGTGPITGIHRHLDNLYAFRDFDVAEARMYKATASGWTQVIMGWVMFFDNRTNKPVKEPINPFNDGAGNTATFLEVIWTTVGETEGYVVIDDFTTGFVVGATIQQDTTNIATVTVAPVAIELLPGGKFEIMSHNFSGGVDTFYMYGADGVNPAFQYRPDADEFIPVYTDQENQTIDTPAFTAAYRDQWFLGFTRGVFRNSEPGIPLLWDAAAGSTELGVGSELTGFDATPLSLTVTTRRTTHALTGSVLENFEVNVSSSKTGATPYTVQHLGTTYMLDDRGVIELRRVQAFGNFENATVSRLIKPLLDVLRPDIVTSVVSRAKNIYRLITSEGRGISMTLLDNNVVSFTEFHVDRNVNVATNQEDETGKERIYFGGSDGFVYEWDTGRSFDGDEKEMWMQPANHYLQSPTILKRFYRMYVDTLINGSATLSIFAELSGASTDKAPVDTANKNFTGLNSQWDVGEWDQALFDARLSLDAHVELDGSGDSISVIFYSNSASDDIITLKDVVYHFKRRRHLRGSR